MNAIEAIRSAAHATGYRAEAVVSNYGFADVLTGEAVTRQVPLVAFTQTPPSYRSAALAVVESTGDQDSFELVRAYRALGAPLLFVISGSDITVWQVRSSDPPRILERTTVDDVGQLFKQNRNRWNPDAIHRAKSIGAADRNYQLDFVDLGLLPAIESELHVKLDRLLVDTLTAATDIQGVNKLDMRHLFRVVFRLLAAKVLQDRRHPFAQRWNSEDLDSVLENIEGYYSLPSVTSSKRKTSHLAFQAAWECLRNGISFANISSDSLAFVYENTLVTPEARKLFGTHSTPRAVAEYVVERLELHQHNPETLNIYEPFAGAGVFLVSALRHLRDSLPTDWSDRKRHNFLVRHLSGDEIDPFGCEVATLSLILADYPNANGWHVQERDLFDGDELAQRMKQSNVILCNPPFEAFDDDERGRYKVAGGAYSKPMLALGAALDAHPVALGFVLPRPFILEKQYAEHRRRIEKLYGSVELVELPDRTFGASVIEASLVIATERRPPAGKSIRIRSTEIADRDRNNFLRTGMISTQREVVREISEEPSGVLWIPALATLWEYLSSYPRMGDLVRPSRGIEWTYDQSVAYADRRAPGFRKGFHSARHLQQFALKQPVWLDCREESLRCGFNQDWDAPKIVANAGRLSRGPWRIGAAVDAKGYVLSQQFFGLWPKTELSHKELLALSAVLNGPVANAFLAIHSPANRLRVKAISDIPIPDFIPKKIGELVEEYSSFLSDKHILSDNDDRLAKLLTEIDAAVLEAYDLPPKLERHLRDYFLGAERPVSHAWAHWDTSLPSEGLRLAERLFGHFKSQGDWPSRVFEPLPEGEVLLLREYGE